MALKVHDIVEVVIVKWNLHGLHNVRIIGFDSYSGLVIPLRNKMPDGTYWTGIYYEGLVLPARVIRIHDKFVDLFEIPK